MAVAPEEPQVPLRRASTDAARTAANDAMRNRHDARGDRSERSPRALRKHARVSLSITPMIDVVFQLLIYFLLTAGFIGDERHLRAELPPERLEGGRDAEFALELEPLVIGISRGAERPSLTLGAGLAPPRDAAELERILRDTMVAADRPDGLFAADHPIRIVADPDVPWQDVVAVFNAVVSAGYRSVAFGGSR